MQCDERASARDAALAEQLRTWVYLKAQVDRTTAQLNQLRDKISEHVERYGAIDESGHLRLAIGQAFEFAGRRYEGIKRERRVTRTVSEQRAQELAERKSLTGRLFPVRPVFDPDELYVLYQEGLVTEREIDDLFDVKVTWAFKPEAEAL